MSKPFPSNIVKICSFSIIVLGIVAILFLFLFECSGQTVPNQLPPQQPQVYFVQARGPLPWIRLNVFGRPSYDAYIGVGQPWSAQVQPVVPYDPYRRAW